MTTEKHEQTLQKNSQEALVNRIKFNGKPFYKYYVSYNKKD
jgi:hypothetical protein